MRASLYVFACALMLLMTAVHLLGQPSDLESWQKEQNQRFGDFLEEDQAAFDQYKADIEQKWLSFKESSISEWVNYGEDLDTRSSVDFENGTVEVVALVPRSDPDANTVAAQKIAQQLKQIVSEDNPSKTSVLKEMLTDQSGKEITPDDAESYVEAEIESGLIIGEPIIGKDGVERIQVKVKLKMVPDHLLKRAQRYLPLVRENCARHDLDIAMVLALIQTESFFNPIAKSHAPAYGLMQLVPKSGGREAYKYIYGVDRIPEPSFLYKPQNNIEMGAGLLAKMRKNEFAGVENTQSAFYCIISAYNTGPSNVARAVTGQKELGPAIRKINQMTPDQLYKTLVEKLPYPETRDYLKKVAERAGNYISLR